MFGSVQLLTAFLSSLLVSGQATVTDQQLAIPTYFYPSGQGATYWKQIEQGSTVGIAVFNPNSGPGTAKDPGYANVLEASAKAGKKVLGYVDTGYFGKAGCGTGCETRNGSKDPNDWTNQIKQDIDAFYNFYGESGLSGIFLDDGLNTCGQNNDNVNLYQNIHQYIKSKHSNGFVVINPGSGVEQCYASVADVMIVFEGNSTFYQTWSQPSWSQNQANGKQFWHLVYGAKSQSDMKNAMKLSRQRNAGYVYVTDDDLPNPWDTLPPYFVAELQQTSV